MLHTKPNWEFEQEYWQQNKIVAGVDEVGRGPLAGPVVAAAVIFGSPIQIQGLNDSKKVSPKNREKLYFEVVNHCIGVSVASVGPSAIDSVNIVKATHLAMRRALEMLKIQPNIVLVDGYKVDIPFQQVPIVKGDSLSFSIAAASIVAKVLRDRMMLFYDTLYNSYNFKANKGYPTKKHREMLSVYSFSPIHRRSFRWVQQELFNNEH